MAEPLIKLTRGVPSPECFPNHELAECANTVLTEQSDVILQYGDAYGYKPLRQLIAQEKGVSENRVIISQGSLQMIDLFSRMILKDGDLVYVEKPTYDRVLTILKRTGAKVEGIPLQTDGPDIEEVAKRLAAGERPVFFYLIPDFQNPSGTVMSLEKRQRLVQLALEYHFWILEDIPYRRLRYRNTEVPALFDMAPDLVMQLSSYSKQICPGLRVGYILAAEDIANPLVKFASDTYIASSFFNQAMVSEFIRRGWLEKNLAAVKEVYRPRLDAMLSALDEYFSDLATWIKPDGGFFIGMTLNTQISTDTLIQKAHQANLDITDGRGFFTEGGDTFIRLPFCALTEVEIHSGIQRLSEVIRKNS